jgi:hypothetical protein
VVAVVEVLAQELAQQMVLAAQEFFTFITKEKQ